MGNSRLVVQFASSFNFGKYLIAINYLQTKHLPQTDGNEN